MKHKMNNLAMPSHGPMVAEMPKPYYPSIHLNEMQMPDLEGYDVNDPVTLTFEGFVIGKHINKHGETEETMFEIELRRGEVARRE